MGTRIHRASRSHHNWHRISLETEVDWMGNDFETQTHDAQGTFEVKR